MAKRLYDDSPAGIAHAKWDLHEAFPGLGDVLFQRLGPDCKALRGCGSGAKSHVRLCLRRGGGPDGLIRWNLTNDAELRAAATGYRYAQHGDKPGSGGYQRYLGVFGVEPPPPFGVEQHLFEANVVPQPELDELREVPPPAERTLAVVMDPHFRTVPCKGCGRSIFWCTVRESGKRISFPAKTVPLKTHVGADGRLHHLYRLRESHWSSCPKANVFKKRQSR